MLFRSGHSRVSNRNPSYYRGPQDPNHPYYHLGFRVVRNPGSVTAISKIPDGSESGLLVNYPNPFNRTTVFRFSLEKAGHISLKIFNSSAQLIAIVTDQVLLAGTHEISWDAPEAYPGLYFAQLQTETNLLTRKMILTR